MRLITTMLALLLASSGAWAEWVRVYETSSANFYYDPATVRKLGNSRIVWVLMDSKVRGPGGLLSVRSREEYDCHKENFRMLNISSHSGGMATGETIQIDMEPSRWSEIPPNTSVEVKLKIVCAQ